MSSSSRIHIMERHPIIAIERGSENHLRLEIADAPGYAATISVTITIADPGRKSDELSFVSAREILRQLEEACVALHRVIESAEPPTDTPLGLEDDVAGEAVPF